MQSIPDFLTPMEEQETQLKRLHPWSNSHLYFLAFSDEGACLLEVFVAQHCKRRGSEGLTFGLLF